MFIKIIKRLSTVSQLIQSLNSNALIAFAAATKQFVNYSKTDENLKRLFQQKIDDETISIVKGSAKVAPIFELKCKDVTLKKALCTLATKMRSTYNKVIIYQTYSMFSPYTFCYVFFFLFPLL